MASKPHLANLAFQAARPLLQVKRMEAIGACSSRLDELAQPSATGGGTPVRGFSADTVPSSGHEVGRGGDSNATSSNADSSSSSSIHRGPRNAFSEGHHAAAAAEMRAEAYHDGKEKFDEDGQRDFQRDRDCALGRILRSSNAAELSAVHFFRGYSQVLHGRVDAQFFEAQEVEAAEGVRQLLPKYRVRPSLAQGPLSLACLALGAAAAAAPPRLGLAVVGAVGDALSEHYNEQLRQLNEAGAAQEAPDVRQTLRSLRDVARIPEGVPAAPDLISVLQEGVAAAASNSSGGGPAVSSVLSGVTGAIREWGFEGTAGALVKAGARVALEAAAQL